MQRRDLFALFGLGGSAALASGLPLKALPVPSASGPFTPVPVPLPLPGDGQSATEQQRTQRRVSLVDRLVVPLGYRADLLAAWGEPLADGHFGFNNDHLSFTDLGEDRALLTVNFEYISPKPWSEGYADATGESLPWLELIEALRSFDGVVDVTALRADDPLRQLARTVAGAALRDQGIGVIELRREPSGQWRRRSGSFDRRVSGLEGLDDPARRLRVSGPAAAVFRSPQRLGYDDGLQDRVIGTFANCAGGETPWGTVLSAEENVQSQVVEAVHADGSSPAPAVLPLRCDGRKFDGLGNAFGLAGNKYGWMVEIDPRQPQRPAVKHSWLGRYRHEAVAVQARATEPLLVYSGCDRHGGHLYRFVSEGRITDPSDPANSALLEAGRLEVARFEPDGSGRWIPLDPATPLNPQRPSHYEGFGLKQPTLVPHSDRSQPGAEALASDQAVETYLQRYGTLADLYPGRSEERLGAILIDAHLAANAVGATAAARPEDTVIDPSSGDLLVAFTAGGSDAGGSADPAIFHGPGGENRWPHGWIMRLQDQGFAEAGRFRWRMLATGGAPWQGGLGFSSPDNLAVDRTGNVWLVTDRGGGKPELDLFGNNSCWVLPSQGAAAGKPFCFATGPMECELTGPCFDAPEATLFLSVQHPGESNGTRSSGAGEWQAIRLRDRDGQEFEQLRWVPLGSNWPSGVPGRSPRPAVVAIRRSGGGPLL
ncbi:PhoX family phosphatase [Synechococcus sp. 1G10]|uniref:PhoX family protein n=1 Tax=Synechococcus sp. 1G10 TaxID=2025605 RepID=UPI000B98C045|nr:alkaline phosphatase PhoX [Synechococcus sp. 1G10]